MISKMALAGLVFLFTYALISIRRFKNVDIRLPYAALIGAAIMLLLNLISPYDAFHSIDFDILLLLLGMMMLAVSLEACGFSEITVKFLAKKGANGKKLLFTTMCTSAFLSAIMLNDAVVLLLTPAVIACCRKLEANPIPYLVGLFVGANAGSVATAVGNPQNAYIASKAGISFINFSIYMIPLAIIVLLISYLILTVVYSKVMNLIPSKDVETNFPSCRLKAVCFILIIMIIAFAFSDLFNVKLHIIAMISGIIAFAIAVIGRENICLKSIKKIDWGVLAFFCGLFIVVGAASTTGLIDFIVKFFPGFSDGTPSIGELTLLSTVLANLISNVPSVMLIAEMLPVGDVGLWITLAASSTLAGNITLIGAAANVIVEEESEKEGISIGFVEYLKAGIPLGVISIITTWIWCSLLF